MTRRVALRRLELVKNRQARSCADAYLSSHRRAAGECSRPSLHAPAPRASVDKVTMGGGAAWCGRVPGEARDGRHLRELTRLRLPSFGEEGLPIADDVARMDVKTRSKPSIHHRWKKDL